MRSYSLILIILILVSLALTNVDILQSEDKAPQPTPNPITSGVPASLSFQGSITQAYNPPTLPTRKWDVLDPKPNAEAVIVHNLDDNIPFFYSNTKEQWALASITKLITAVLIIEDVGLNKKIPISKQAVETEGVAGNLKSGEVYTSRDLLQIMLLASSNDAAAAFEEYLGNKDVAATKINTKAKAIGMANTTIYDGSGISDLNKGTASDILKLIKYIIKYHPQILTWTRTEKTLFQPINDTEVKTIYNINNLINSKYFLGGKTGTSEQARENLAVVMSLNNKKVTFIILGSNDRYSEVERLSSWVQEAYNF